MFETKGVGSRLSMGLQMYRIVWVFNSVIFLVVAIFYLQRSLDIIRRINDGILDSNITSQITLHILTEVLKKGFLVFIGWLVYGWIREWVVQFEKYRNGLSFVARRMDQLSSTLTKWIKAFQWISAIYVAYMMFGATRGINVAEYINSFMGIASSVAAFFAFGYAAESIDMVDHYFPKESTAKLLAVDKENSLKKLKQAVIYFQIFSILSIISNFIVGMIGKISLDKINNDILGFFTGASIAAPAVGFFLVYSAAMGIFMVVLLQLFKIFIESLLDKVEQNSNAPLILPLS